MDVTFCIPIGPAHTALADRAVGSIKAQTVPASVLTMQDTERRGPGYLRNRMLVEVRTPFVAFLDADDWIEPTFTEHTLTAWHRSGRYVYTDWYQDDKIVAAPDRAWFNATFHVITTLIPTTWALAVGGFDETFSGCEDTDFYLSLLAAKYCGVRLPLPLFHYSNDGTRSKEYRASPDREAVRNEIGRRYINLMPCSDCNGSMVPDVPLGEQQPGDVLAQAQWTGNANKLGVATGRMYPRMSYPARTWVAPNDISAAPHLWRATDDNPLAALPTVHGTAGLAALMMAGRARGQKHYQRATDVPEPIAPDFKAVVEKATRR